jgi:hypothetical protein
VGLGPFALGLAQVDELEPSGRASLWLYCDELDAEVDALREAGVEVVREPQDMEWRADGDDLRPRRERDPPRAALGREHVDGRLRPGSQRFGGSGGEP